VAGGLVLFPVMLLVGVSAILFGPVLGDDLCADRRHDERGDDVRNRSPPEQGGVRELAGRRLNDLSRRLGERGLLAIIFVRVVPVGPFSIVNVVAGASHIRWRDFLLGTLIGLLPGVTAASIFVDRVAAAIREPGAGTFVLVAAAGAALIALVWIITRKLHARAEARREPVPQVHGS
jgi:uncharacterized membrane protein YdjX (TVP38/TMEM64 family)